MPQGTKVMKNWGDVTFYYNENPMPHKKKIMLIMINLMSDFDVVIDKALHDFSQSFKQLEDRYKYYSHSWDQKIHILKIRKLK